LATLTMEGIETAMRTSPWTCRVWDLPEDVPRPQKRNCLHPNGCENGQRRMLLLWQH
jgi:hypothetical protein